VGAHIDERAHTGTELPFTTFVGALKPCSAEEKRKINDGARVPGVRDTWFLFKRKSCVTIVSW
jgi:hypothetical protein